MFAVRRPARRASAAALLAVVGISPSLIDPATAHAQPCASDSTGYCAMDNCDQCRDDGWWDRVCGFCSDRGDDLKRLRRKCYWKSNDTHHSTLYPEFSPFCSPTYGYYQTCWRPFPFEGSRCPQYITTPAMETWPSPAAPALAPPMSATPMPPGPGAEPAPAGTEPYFPQQPSEQGAPPTPPERLEGEPDAALPLGTIELQPVEAVFTTDGWEPRSPRNRRPLVHGFYEIE